MEYNDLNTSLFHNPLMVDMMFTQGIDAFIDVAKELGGFERYIPKLVTFKSTFPSKALKTYTPNRNDCGYNVLNHADFHTKNVLFKKSADGSIEDFNFVSCRIPLFVFTCGLQIHLVFRSISNSAFMRRQQLI